MSTMGGAGRTMTRATMWLGILTCVTLVSGWVLSAWVSHSFDHVFFQADGERIVYLELSEGGVEIQALFSPKDTSTIAIHYGHGWRSREVPNAPRLRHWFKFRDATMGVLAVWELFVPLWAPFLLCLTFTLMAWRRVHNRPGYCRCGYSLAGLEKNAACPECGRSRVQKASTQLDH